VRTTPIICDDCDAPLKAGKCACEDPELSPAKATPVAAAFVQVGDTMIWIRRSREKKVIDKMEVTVLAIGKSKKRVKIQSPAHKKPVWVRKYNLI
jgi:hypothetical protein